MSPAKVKDKSSTGGSEAAKTKKIMALRDEGVSWAEVAAEVDLPPGKCMALDLIGRVKPGEKITAKNEDELARKIVKARDDEKLSWGVIMARAGVPESKVRSLYEAATGSSTLGNRIGKGGRFPNGSNGAAKPAKKAQKSAKAVKKATKAVKAQKATKAKKSAKEAG